MMVALPDDGHWRTRLHPDARADAHVASAASVLPEADVFAEWSTAAFPSALLPSHGQQLAMWDAF